MQDGLQDGLQVETAVEEVLDMAEVSSRISAKPTVGCLSEHLEQRPKSVTGRKQALAHRGGRGHRMRRVAVHADAVKAAWQQLAAHRDDAAALDHAQHMRQAIGAVAEDSAGHAARHQVALVGIGAVGENLVRKTKRIFKK